MKSFKDFLESEAPASVDSNVGKPDGGKVKKEPEVERPPGLPEPKSFKEIFGNIFGDIFKK